MAQTGDWYIFSYGNMKQNETAHCDTHESAEHILHVMELLQIWFKSPYQIFSCELLITQTQTLQALFL